MEKTPEHKARLALRFSQKKLYRLHDEYHAQLKIVDANGTYLDMLELEKEYIQSMLDTKALEESTEQGWSTYEKMCELRTSVDDTRHALLTEHEGYTVDNTTGRLLKNGRDLIDGS